MDNQPNKHLNCQENTSKMFQSLIYNYKSNSLYQSGTQQSQLTIHDLNYNSYQTQRSNTSQKQDSHLLELMERKESHLKNLETFLLKQLELISENKSKNMKIKSSLSCILSELKQMKSLLSTKISDEFNIIKQQIGNQLLSILQQFMNYKQNLSLKHQTEIIQLQKKIQQQELTNKNLTLKNFQYQTLIDKFNIQINNSNQISSKSVHEIQQISIEKNYPENDLEVSFSADKNNQTKNLINAIINLQPNCQKHLEDNTNKNIENQIKLSTKSLTEQNQRNKEEFNQILHSSSESSQDHHQVRQQGKHSLPTNSQNMQVSSVYKLNESNNNICNDTSSAINKLDVFSELSAANYSQDDQFSLDRNYYDQQDDEKYSQIGSKIMKKGKVLKKIQINQNFNQGLINGITIENLSIQKNNVLQPKLIQHCEKSSIQNNKQLIEDKVKTSSQAEQKEKFQTLTYSNKKIQECIQNFQSPNVKRHKTHRYDYCQLYEEQQLKEMTSISNLYNQLTNQKCNFIENKTNSTELNSFEKIERFITPIKQKQISPMILHSKYQEQFNLDNNSRRLQNKSIHGLSISQKQLTIQIPVSPHKQSKKQFQVETNPYLKLEKHLHQLSYQQFSPNQIIERQKVNHKKWREINPKSFAINNYRNLDNINHNKNNEQRKALNQKQSNSSFDPMIVADRKDYIRSKIQMIKMKNLIENSSHSSNKISFLKYEEPQSRISKLQLQRLVVQRPLSKSYQQVNNPIVNGYNYQQDKLKKQIIKKNRKIQANQCQPNFTKIDSEQSKNFSLTSYKKQKSPSFSSSFKQNNQQNNIYEQLNSGITQLPEIKDQSRISTLKQSLSKKLINGKQRANLQHQNSSPLILSPLRQATLTPKKLCIQSENPISMKQQIKKQQATTQYHYQQQKYTKQNLFRHPYVRDKNKDSSKPNQNLNFFENNGIFRRF